MMSSYDISVDGFKEPYIDVFTSLICEVFGPDDIKYHLVHDSVIESS